MGYSSARTCFEKAKNESRDQVLRNLAEGLIDFSRAVEDQVERLQREVRDIESKVNSLR